MLCRIKCQIFINLPDEFCTWRGHYENDEWKKRMLSTTFWSQLVIARKLWMEKCKSRGLPSNKNLQDILSWCELPQNQLVDNETKTKRPRWSESDNAKWRKEVVANLFVAKYQCKHPRMLPGRCSEVGVCVDHVEEFCPGRGQASSPLPHCNVGLNSRSD